MKEAVAGDREVALESEEYPGMVGLGICMKKGLGCLDRLGIFFFSRFPLWGSYQLLLQMNNISCHLPLLCTAQHCY